MRTLMVALRVTVVTLVVTGLGYPFVVTALARVVFPSASEGSLVRDAKGTVVGSSLIGQAFANPAYFQGRPSAAGNGYDPLASGGSNYGPASAKLRERARGDAKKLADANPGAGPVPVELVTASASGLDPHISPEAARWQLARVAKARGVEPARIQPLIERAVEGPDLGFIGEPRVNVLALNREVDKLLGAPAR